MAIISYAQAREDVMLWRALASRVHHEQGFWIDVGGYDPVIDSVTQLFYNHGWHGINVEPLADNHERFVKSRPRDINIRAAVSNEPGEVVFHEIVGHQLGTLVDKFADRHAAAGLERVSYAVPAMTLTQICEAHAPTDIHFLKIDVEGHEGPVISGMDFKRFRPWILVIEATEPNSHVPTFGEWDEAVREAGYTFAHTDGLNRYYVAVERSELLPQFALPADNYVLAADILLRRELEQKLAAAEARLRTLESSSSAIAATQMAND